MACFGDPVMRRVLDAMSAKPVLIPIGASAGHARRVAELAHVHHLLVVDADDLVGVTCLCDLADLPQETPIAPHVHSPYVFVTVESTTADAAIVMLECGVGCLPVLDEAGQLQGVITRRDLRRAGALPGARGIDACAGCGDTHALKPTPRGGDIVFCRDCLERARPHGQRDEQTTLGGYD
jgi:CBS domain-containing protein